MRYLRLILGIIVVLVATWIIVGEQISGASANAVVNAEVVTVRADVAGNLSLAERSLGARVAEGEALAAIDDALVDTVRLDDLRMEQSLAAAERAFAQRMVEKTREIRKALGKRGDTFREERIAEIRTRLDHAERRLELIETGGAPDAGEQELIDGLDTRQDRTPFQPLTSELARDHARERVEVLRIALRAAEAGVFLGDGYNDAPNAEQRATELSSEIAQYEADAERAAARLAALEKRVSRAQVRANAQRGGEITSPVSGLYWEVLQADGVTVQRGDPILRIADCASTFVTLSVTERIYNSLTLGQAADVRLLGEDTVYDATVMRLAGSGAATVYRNLAVAGLMLDALRRMSPSWPTPDFDVEHERQRLADEAPVS